MNPSTEAPTPAPKASWTMLAILTALAMLSSIDRHFIVLTVASIKADLRLTDIQIGLVIGPAFALAQTFVSLPAGWLADRMSRRKLIGCGVFVWSVMAAACGLAGSFAQLFAARFGVGAGEGLSPPASYSLIRDGFAPSHRGRAFGVFSFAGAAGTGTAFLMGGLLLAAIGHSGITALPFIGPVRPWQLALIVIGVVGLPLTLLVALFPDPGHGLGAAHVMPLKETMRAMRSKLFVLVPLALFSILMTLLSAGIAAWVPPMLERSHGLRPAQIGIMLGAMLIIFAPIGLVCAGLVIDRFARHGLAVAAIASSFGMIVAGTGLSQTDSIPVYVAFHSVLILVAGIYMPVTSTLVSAILPSRAVGTTMAVLLTLQGVFGAGLGPIVVATFTEHLFAGAPRALNDALTATAVLFGLSALASALWMRGAVDRQRRAAGD